MPICEIYSQKVATSSKQPCSITMMSELQGSETDDDQALDEFFEDMMQTVRGHFAAEERDMFPLIDG
jgi:hemerythrin